MLGKGNSLEEVISGMGMVIEGIRTTKAARQLATKYDVAMPLTEALYAVLFENISTERSGRPTHESNKETGSRGFLRQPIIFTMKGGLAMSSMDKMWLSFYAMGFMFISMGLIYVSRHKLKNRILKFFFALIAYSLLIFSFFAMVYLVFNPTRSGGA